ncbi:MAG: hypothetical protein LBR84_07770, partial [Tannerella sp.]|nr:hypothetical protein [Tannerella sp.]
MRIRLNRTGFGAVARHCEVRSNLQFARVVAIALLGAVLSLVTTTAAYGQGSGLAGAPTITKQAVGGAFAKNAALRLYIQATSPDDGYLTYQWWRTQDTVPQSVA